MFVTNDSTIKVIAYFLFLYRHSNGRGWSMQAGSKIPTLQWNHGAQTATNGNRSQVPVTTTVAAVRSPPVLKSEATV